MGKGKGNVHLWIAKVSCGQILFEVLGKNKQLIFEYLKSASRKLPLKTLIVQK
jgi:ribosomal protein L16/L10AE